MCQLCALRERLSQTRWPNSLQKRRDEVSQALEVVHKEYMVLVNTRGDHNLSIDPLGPTMIREIENQVLNELDRFSLIVDELDRSAETWFSEKERKLKEGTNGKKIDELQRIKQSLMPLIEEARARAGRFRAIELQRAQNSHWNNNMCQLCELELPMLNFTWPMRMEDEAKEVVLQLPDVHEAFIIYDETRKLMNSDTVEEYLDLFDDYKDVIPAHMTLRKILEKFDSELYTLFKRVEELEDAYQDWLCYCTSLEPGEEDDGRGTEVSAKELCKMMVRVSETIEYFRRFGCWNWGSLHMKESDLKVIYNVESSQARKLSSK